MLRHSHLHPSQTALIEIGIMFLPAIPAYLWVWPNVEGTGFWIFQSLSYIYVFWGTLYIGLRRWSPRELGLNRNGLGLSLIFGLIIVTGRTFIILAVDWGLDPRPFSLPRVLGEALFYFGLAGLVEELLFRGLVYHALETRHSTRWAIWGSSLGFMLWHVFGQGPLIGLATLFYGLIFALMRWHAGGIVGLIFVHGLMDFIGVQMLPSTDVVGLGRPAVLHPSLLVLGCALLLVVPLYLWLVHPLSIGLGAPTRHRC